jgi:ferrous iron transport protein A
MPLTLDQLKQGEQAVVTQLLSTGVNRRRLLDLGVLPGTRLSAELQSPLGDPRAYRIRDALIAIRKNQAREIQVERVKECQS